MRTGLDGTTSALYLSGDYDTHMRVKIANGSGTLVDLTSRCKAAVCRLPDPREPIGSLELDFIRDSTALGTAGSLSPTVDASTFNKLDDTVTYSPLLQLGRLVTFEVILTAKGAARPGDADVRWYEILRCVVARVQFPEYDSRTVTVKANGNGAILQHAKSEDFYTYAQGTSLEDVVDQVLLNNGFGGTAVAFPAPTGKVLPNTYAPGLQKTVWSQLKAIAQSMGWLVYYRYIGQNPQELTFFAPARTKVVADMTVVADDFRTLDLDEAEVRNVGYLIYVDGAGVEQLLGPEENAASITKYGGFRRIFWIKLDVNSPVRDAVAGQAMLDAALSDVADPDIVAVADTVPLVFGESGIDLYTIPAVDRFFDGNQTWALFSNTIRFASNTEPRSSIGVRGVPTAGVKSWRELATKNPGDVKITIYEQASPPTNARIGDLWIDTDDGNRRHRWDGTVWADVTRIVDGEEIEDGTIPGEKFDIILLGNATSVLVGDGVFLGDTGTFYEFRAGDPNGNYIHWDGVDLFISGAIEADVGLIGGWTIEADRLEAGNVAIIAGSEQILMGAATAPLVGVGIFLGLSAGEYQARLGDPAGDYILWDGTAIILSGEIVQNQNIVNGAIDSLKIADEAVIAAKLDGTARSQHGVFMEVFEIDPQWRLASGVGVGSIVAGVGVAGGNVYQAVGQRWLVYQDKIPYDPSKLYRLRGRVRMTDDGTTVGNTRFYLGIQGIAADGVTRVNISGADSDSSQHYIAASSVDMSGFPLNEWQEFTGWFAGHAAVTGESGAHPNASDPAALHPNVRYVAPLTILNYQNGDSTMQLDYVVVDVFDEDGLVRSYLGLNVDGVVAADKVVAGSIQSGVITGVHIQTMNISGKTATFDTGTIAGWLMSAGTLTSGNITISSSSEQVLMGAATAPLTGVGIFLGLDNGLYEFRAGDPAGDYIHWNGSSLTIEAALVTIDSILSVGDLRVRPAGVLEGFRFSSSTTMDLAIEVSGGGTSVSSTVLQQAFGTLTFVQNTTVPPASSGNNDILSLHTDQNDNSSIEFHVPTVYPSGSIIKDLVIHNAENVDFGTIAAGSYASADVDVVGVTIADAIFIARRGGGVVFNIFHMGEFLNTDTIRIFAFNPNSGSFAHNDIDLTIFIYKYTP